MNNTKLPLTELLYLRSLENLPLYKQEYPGGKITLSITLKDGTLYSATTDWRDPSYQAMRAYCNRPIFYENMMIKTHDFSDAANWNNGPNTDSNYSLKANPGSKLIITSIVTRLPEDLDLSTNHMLFKVYKSPDAKMVVNEYFPPAVADEYTSLKDLMMISNDPVDSFMMSVAGGSIPMIDIKFRYADSDQSNYSKLSLSSKLNERIDITLTDPTTAPQRIEGRGLAEPVYAWFNCKRVMDF